MVVVSSGRAERTTERDTARTETQRVPTRPDDTSSVTAVCIKPWKEYCAHVIHDVIVTSCVVFSRVPRTPHRPF